MAQIHEGHKLTTHKLQESTAKYKASADKKRRAVEFEEGDFVWAILTKDRFPMESTTSCWLVGGSYRDNQENQSECIPVEAIKPY